MTDSTNAAHNAAMNRLIRQRVGYTEPPQQPETPPRVRSNAGAGNGTGASGVPLPPTDMNAWIRRIAGVAAD